MWSSKWVALFRPYAKTLGKAEVVSRERRVALKDDLAHPHRSLIQLRAALDLGSVSAPYLLGDANPTFVEFSLMHKDLPLQLLLPFLSIPSPDIVNIR